MLRALRQPHGSDVEFKQDDSIVLVGMGIAALTCLRQLKQEGFKNVRIIAKTPLYGGKCINYGCMPAEFVSAHRYKMPDEIFRLLQDFIVELRSDIHKQFDELGYPVLIENVESIQDSNVLLSSSESVGFDRLILATGSRYLLPAQIPACLSKLVPIPLFWHIPPGRKLVIYAEDNIAALSIADTALSLGHSTTILLAGTNPLAGLPSFRYFLREVRAQGVSIHENIHLVNVDESEICFEKKGQSTSLAYDHLLNIGKPVPNIPAIDGRVPEIFDMDMTSSSLPSRPDIAFLGDCAGLFSASAAENHAKLLMRYWKSGKRLNLLDLDKAPVLLNGRKSLAMAGDDWQYVARRWNELDFRSIAWSKAHRLDGKLWYLFNEESGRVEALHICHKQAAELINIGAALMEYPIHESVWMTTSHHSSSAEIFKVVAEKATAAMKKMDNSEEKVRAYTFECPSIHDLHPSSGLPDWLTIERFNQAMTSIFPNLVFLVYYGLWKLHTVGGCVADYQASMDDKGAIIIARPAGIDILVDQQMNRCRISTDSHVVTCQLMPAFV
ncbi:MAG: NAD(P)/FAD-dependent oxidoreductase [Chlorobiaceae bacterium]|nr:NAD(P)/FAD-dependent oxidoreductase [Chlorobiaceae bacterium]